MGISSYTRKAVGEVFKEIAEGIERGNFGKKIKVGLTTLGSEHGIHELVKGGELAQQDPDIEVVLIGPRIQNAPLETMETGECEEDLHKKMEELLQNNAIDACVTMHYNFPLGVATVGKVVTPGRGKEMFIATTTGTSSTDRIEAMVKNALYGIAVARASGIQQPTIGVLNVDGARRVEKILKQLARNGYEITFSESIRQDGGCVMRGNDLLSGTPDVMVTDSLTGNILIKVFSAFTTGGNYESLGYGYGPGVGKGFNKIINIISRASGAPVIAKAIRFAADMVKGELLKLKEYEINNAEKAGLSRLLQDTEKEEAEKKDVTPPPAKPVTQEISGIDIMELDRAVRVLWKNGIFAKTGMGCTGPVILTAPEDYERAKELLKDYIA